MSTDGVGKGGGGPPPPRSAGESRGALERLRAGEIALSQYLDLKVAEATAHLERRLPEEQLSFVRNSLREQLASDPELVDLVKASTGLVPPRGE